MSTLHTNTSTNHATPIDRLSCVLETFHVRAHLLDAGLLRHNRHYPADAAHGHLHVLRAGALEVRHASACRGLPRRLAVTTPTVLFYPGPTPHDFHIAGDHADVTCATLHFDGAANNPLVRALPQLIAIPLAQVDGLEPALTLLWSETERVRCGQRVLVDRLLEVVIIQLLRWLLDQPTEAGVQPGLITGLSDPRIARALLSIHERPGEPWTLARMAAIAGMSRSAFTVAFKVILGQTPADYLASWRIAVAQKRLRNGDSVSTIALELGYSNPSGFSRAFRARTGVSPRTWRQRAEHRQ